MSNQEETLSSPRAHRAADSRIVRQAPTTDLSPSSTGKCCQELLDRCIDGDYAVLPDFAVKVWEWFAETPRATDPSTMARNVGQKAAFLLFSMNAKLSDKAAPPKAALADTPTPLGRTHMPVWLAFLSGYFVENTYAWAVCTAWMSMQLLSATKMFERVQTASPLCECLVFVHGYYNLAQSAGVSALHALAWYAVWNWSVWLRPRRGAKGERGREAE